jgi:hypothetical protein
MYSQPFKQFLTIKVNRLRVCCIETCEMNTKKHKRICAMENRFHSIHSQLFLIVSQSFFQELNIYMRWSRNDFPFNFLIPKRENMCFKGNKKFITKNDPRNCMQTKFSFFEFSSCTCCMFFIVQVLLFT